MEEPRPSNWHTDIKEGQTRTLTNLSHLTLVSYNETDQSKIHQQRGEGFFFPSKHTTEQSVERMNTDTECCDSSEEALAG